MSITTALKARREALTDREAGFTLIELLVVVIIIGILAAIAIPIYIGVQNNAKDSSVKSDLSNQKTAVVAYETDKGTLPPAASFTTAGLGSYGFTAGNAINGAETYSSDAATTKFCIQATSVTTNKFYVTSSAGVTAGTCPAGVANW